MPDMIEEQLAVCMSDYDAKAAAEPDPTVRRLMQRDRDKVADYVCRIITERQRAVAERDELHAGELH